METVIIYNDMSDNVLLEHTRNNKNTVEENKITADIKQYMREYRKNNMEKWNESRICADCGGKYTICNHTNHTRSKKHTYALILKENEKLQQIKNIIGNTIKL
jgi:hypothetical protein